MQAEAPGPHFQVEFFHSKITHKTIHMQVLYIIKNHSVSRIMGRMRILGRILSGSWVESYQDVISVSKIFSDCPITYNLIGRD